MTTNEAIIKGPNANVVYPAAVAAVMGGGKQVPSRVAPTLEIHPATIIIDDPLRPVVTAFGRPVNVTFAFAEVLWILGGQNDVEMLKHYNSKIGDYSDDGETFNAAYGYRLRYAHGHDQIEDVVRLLTEDPETRQAVLTITLPSHDRAYQPMRVPSDTDNYAFEEVRRETKDRACNLMAHLMIRDGRLDWLQILRSNDVMWGTPYNFIQWMSMQRYIAGRLGIPVGTYTHVADSLHAYEYHHAEAEDIAEFDLYQAVQDGWGFGGHWTWETADLTDEVLASVRSYEMALRTCEWDQVESLLFNAHQEVPVSWIGLLEAFAAHTLYKKGFDLKAAHTLLGCMDPVLGLAQARFYYYHRWHKKGHEDVVDHLRGPHPITGEKVPTEVLDWMFASHVPSE